MGYVIQDGGLFPHLTAEENVSLMARHLGWEKERIRARVSELYLAGVRDAARCTRIDILYVDWKARCTLTGLGRAPANNNRGPTATSEEVT